MNSHLLRFLSEIYESKCGKPRGTGRYESTVGLMAFQEAGLDNR